MTMPEKLAWKRYRESGCSRAKEAIIERYSDLVRSLAHRVKGDHVSLEFDDLFAIGLVGLSKAIDTYTPGKSKFATHAYHTVHGAIRHGVCAASHLSSHVLAQISKTGECRPEHLGYVAFSQLGSDENPWDESFGTQKGGASCALFGDPAEILAEEARISAMLAILTPDQRAVIERIHIREMSYADTAAELGMSTKRVGHLAMVAMKRLRNAI